MAIKIGETQMRKYTTVLFEGPLRRSGKMQKQVTDYCEDVERFRQQVERRGGKIIHVGATRMAESVDVFF